jgi:hypothetical protein
MRKLSVMAVNRKMASRQLSSRVFTVRVTTIPPALVGLIAVVSIGCAVGARHTPDAKMEKMFADHQAGFRQLLETVESDSRLEMITPNSLRYGAQSVTGSDMRDIELAGMKRSNWRAYTKMLRELGIAQVFRTEHGIQFKVESASISNGSSDKGYWYSEQTPGHQVSSLDQYRISPRDRDGSGNYLVSRPLKGNWHLFLFVNGG